MTTHRSDLGDGELFVYGQHDDIFVSVCAPITATKAEVESFANANAPGGKPYEAVNKLVFGKKHGIDMGLKTPNPCDQEPQKRLHWFLVSVRFL